MSITADKRALRRTLLARLEGLSPLERERSDDALFRGFLALPEVKRSQRLFLFLGVPGREPDTRRLLEALWAQGRQTALPRMLPGRRMEFRQYAPDRPLVRTSFGVWEPGEDSPVVPPSWGQAALVPGVAFDREGFRLGFGGGYYDRWLPGFDGPRVGLCRECVLQDRLPREDHDCPVHLVLTEKERSGISPASPLSTGP